MMRLVYDTKGVPNGDVCISFWYNMNGRDSGRLLVDLASDRYCESVIDRVLDNYLMVPLWSRVADSGDRWMHGQIEIAKDHTVCMNVHPCI